MGHDGSTENNNTVMNDKADKPEEDEEDDESVIVNKILVVGVYLWWNYWLHLSYWHFEDSWLNDYVKHGQTSRLYGIHILHAITIVLYFIAVFKSPGEVQPVNTLTGHSSDIHHPKYCEICTVIRPRMSKHCYKCDKCIIGYDHHCLFTANCVGADNHHIFLLYILIQDLFLLWCFPMSFDAMIFGLSHQDQIGFTQLVYRCGCCLLIGFALIGLALLFTFHLYLIHSNQTTYVYVKKYGCCSGGKQGDYDKKHFDTDLRSDSTDSSFLSKVMCFMFDPVPLEWRMSTMENGTVSGKFEKNLNSRFMDRAGVGCVPLPSFNQLKQD